MIQQENDRSKGARDRSLDTACSSVPAVDRLEIMRQGANGNTINFKDSKEPVLHADGMVYLTLVHIAYGSPIKGEGKTIAEARESAAQQLIANLSDGSIIFSPQGKLEFHKNHQDKFQKKYRK